MKSIESAVTTSDTRWLRARLLVVEAQVAQPLGARALEELEVFAVVDHAARVGVLVVDPHWETNIRTVRVAARAWWRCGSWRGGSALRGGIEEVAAPVRGWTSPKWRQARAVATRPRGVRCRKPCWMRNGSSTSSMVSRSSPMAAARFSTPTGPPANFSITAERSFLSMRSRPIASTSSMRSAVSATPAVTSPVAFTSA